METYGTSPPHPFLQPIFLESESLNEDTLLRFFDLKCPYYDHRVTNNQASCPVIPPLVVDPHINNLFCSCRVCLT